MKLNISNILNGVVGVTAILTLWSCSAETPFDREGEGTIRLNTVVNPITTRAEDQNSTDPLQELKNKCVVYISGEKGLVYKKVGLHNVDQQITLKSGHYAAEAWTGDSVSASFDKKFFRGYEAFDVTKGSQQNISLNCKIQNVVASINTSTIDPNLMKDDYTISIKNSHGEIVFNKDNASSERAYFMMPNGETALEYTISGSRHDGQPFTKSGSIEGVQRAHHYILNFEYNPNGSGQNSSNSGAVFLQIKIKDEDIHESQNVSVHTRPTITGVDFKIDKQQVYLSDTDIPESLNLQLCGFKGLKELAVTSPSASELGIPADSINLFNADANLLQPYRNAGLVWTVPDYNVKTDVATAYLTIPKSMIERLSTAAAKEHVIWVTIKDGDTDPQIQSATLRIARNESSIVIEDPIVFDKVDQDNAFAITSNAVTLTYTLADDIDGNPGVEYAKDGEDEWTFVPASTPSAISRKGLMKASPVKYTVTITGLEAATAYKYRAACGDFHSEQIMKFETYSKFIIPNWNMEQWASISAGGQNGVKVPSRTGAADFWGNGNPGAKMAGTVLTDESTDMFHSATKSARLESKFASVFGIGKFAAGNLFAGEYVKTDGTDGVLKFGQPFADYSDGKKVDVRPSALKVYANYRPKPGVKDEGADASYIGVGDLDQAQIYVALTTAPVDIRTKKKDQKLFNPNDPEVLAYGQYTFEGNYGSDGQLKELIIPIEYFERSEGVLPTHLVIVCSASKYGDYFSGGVGSTMYLDDFELVYE